MGLTRQSAKVRGQGECFSLGAEFRDTQSSSVPPLGEERQTLTHRHPTMQMRVSCQPPRTSRWGGKARSRAGRVFPQRPANRVHSSGIPPQAAAGVQEQEGRNGYILWLYGRGTSGTSQEDQGLRESCGITHTPLNRGATKQRGFLNVNLTW